MRDVSGWTECVYVCGDGVKPKALAPQSYNVRMTGGLRLDISGVRVGIPAVSVFETEEFGVQCKEGVNGYVSLQCVAAAAIKELNTKFKTHITGIQRDVS